MFTDVAKLEGSHSYVFANSETVEESINLRRITPTLKSVGMRRGDLASVDVHRCNQLVISELNAQYQWHKAIYIKDVRHKVCVISDVLFMLKLKDKAEDLTSDDIESLKRKSGRGLLMLRGFVGRVLTKDGELLSSMSGAKRKQKGCKFTDIKVLELGNRLYLRHKGVGEGEVWLQLDPIDDEQIPRIG